MPGSHTGTSLVPVQYDMYISTRSSTILLVPVQYDMYISAIHRSSTTCRILRVHVQLVSTESGSIGENDQRHGDGIGDNDQRHGDGNIAVIP